ncbi:MAG: hypothetical protein ACTHNH_02890 [Mesorhizobium sp.]
MGDRAAEGGQAEFEERGEDFACASLLPLKACPCVRIVHLSPLRSEGEVSSYSPDRQIRSKRFIPTRHEQGLHDRHLTSPAGGRNEKRRPEAALSQKDNETRIT